MAGTDRKCDVCGDSDSALIMGFSGLIKGGQGIAPVKTPKAEMSLSGWPKTSGFSAWSAFFGLAARYFSGFRA
jgi:hypothetical protein